MRSYKTMYIRFIRDINNSNKDDKLTITPIYHKSPETFEINFQYSSCSTLSNNDAIHKFNLKKDDILVYIRSIINLTSIDSEPFDSIQVDLPGFPTVLIKGVNSDKILSNLYDSISILLSTNESWPFEESKSQSIPLPQVNTHKYFDSDGDTIPNEDDDDDSYVCI